jgi:hypothetical protein
VLWTVQCSYRGTTWHINALFNLSDLMQSAQVTGMLQPPGSVGHVTCSSG